MIWRCPAWPSEALNLYPEVCVSGQRLLLLPQRCAWWPQAGTLLVADAHIGKAVSFRRLGVPVPQGTTGDTLARLAAAVAATQAQRVVFLGDFLHSARSLAPATLAAVRAWRAQHAALALTLVRGNHDAHAGDPPTELGMQVVDEPWPCQGLLLCHHPVPHDGGYVLAGHTHPGVVLGRRAADRVRLPCFHFGPRVGVLPAFGAFTGLHVLPRVAGDRVFAVAGDAVLTLPEIPPSP